MPDASQAVDPELWCHDGLAVGELLEDLANSAWVALQSTYQGPPAEVFVGHGVPADDACDFVAVSMLGLYPARTGRFPEVYLGSNRAAHEGVNLQPLVALHLRRPCQPVPVASRSNPFPTAAALDANARSLAADARALTQVWKRAAEELVAAWCGAGSSAVSWEDLVPHQEADCGGWTWNFRIELENCTGGAWEGVEIPDYTLPEGTEPTAMVVPDDADRARAFVAGSGAAVDAELWGHDGQLVAVLLEDLVVAAWSSLAHSRLGSPAGLFLNHAGAPDDAGDFVALSIVGWEPTLAGTALELHNGSERGQTTGVMMAPIVELQVRRPCAPIPGASGAMPVPADKQAHAIDQLIDARCLTQRWKPVASMLVGAWCATGHAGIAWSTIEPVIGGAVAGWNWRMRLELLDCSPCGPDYVAGPDGGYALPADDYPAELVAAHEAEADPHPGYARVLQAGNRPGRRVVVVADGEADPTGLEAGDVVVAADASGLASIRMVL